MLLELLQVCALLLAFTLYCAVVGFGALRLTFGGAPRSTSIPNEFLEWFFAISIGLVASALLLTVLAGCQLFRRDVVLGAFALSGLVSAPLFVSHLRRRGFSAASSKVSIFALSSAFLLVLIHAMQAPGHWDDTMYHLPLARSYLETEGLRLNEFLRFPLFPQNMNLIIALGLDLGGEFGAQAFATLPVFIMLLGLLGASQWMTDEILVGCLAFVFLVAMSPVRFTLGYAYVDNGLAVICWAAILGTGLSTLANSSREKNGWIVYAGIMTAGAVGTKYFGVAFAAVLFLWIAIHYRRMRPLALFSCTVLLLGSFWYVRSYVISGDPIHPAGGSFFGYFLWNEADLLSQSREQHSFGVPVLSFNLPKAMSEAGAVLLMPALLSVVLRAPNPGFRVIRFCFLLYVVLWFIVTQVDRYLAPIFAAGALLSALVAVKSIGWMTKTALELPAINSRLPPSVLKFSGYTKTILVVAVFSYLPIEQALKSHPTEEAWNKALSDRAGHDLMQVANQYGGDQGLRLVQIGFENAIYFFDGVVIGDHFGPGRYRELLDCSGKACTLPPADQLRTLLNRFDAGMLLISRKYSQSNLEADYQEQFKLIARDEFGTLLALRD